MKEATGELNMTVVTVVAIAAIAGFFYVFVWPAIQNSIKSNTQCANAICDCSAGQKVCDCTYVSDGSQQSVKCNNKVDVD